MSKRERTVKFEPVELKAAQPGWHVRIGELGIDGKRTCVAAGLADRQKRAHDAFPFKPRNAFAVALVNDRLFDRCEILKFASLRQFVCSPRRVFDGAQIVVHHVGVLRRLTGQLPTSSSHL
jgi:hypothetical protein